MRHTSSQSKTRNFHALLLHHKNTIHNTLQHTATKLNIQLNITIHITIHNTISTPQFSTIQHHNFNTHHSTHLHTSFSRTFAASTSLGSSSVVSWYFQMFGWRYSALSSKFNLASATKTFPVSVRARGLISICVASVETNASYL
jgi:hypothetical protein